MLSAGRERSRSSSSSLRKGGRDGGCDDGYGAAPCLSSDARRAALACGGDRAALGAVSSRALIHWSGGSRRFIYGPEKLNPDAPTWMANSFQSAMPGVLLGTDHLIAFLLRPLEELPRRREVDLVLQRQPAHQGSEAERNLENVIL
jgi:hypothetical protein